MLAFYKVDNSQGYGRHTFDLIPKYSDIMEMLYKLTDDELLVYDMDNEFDRQYFETDFNDEVLDGGWWMIIIND
jgi:hypothetical protein